MIERLLNKILGRNGEIDYERMTLYENRIGEGDKCLLQIAKCP